jgi:hypothetical protein
MFYKIVVFPEMELESPIKSNPMSRLLAKFVMVKESSFIVKQGELTPK